MYPQSTGINFSKNNSESRDENWKLINLPPSETFIPGNYAWIEKKSSINSQKSTAYWLGSSVSGISNPGDYVYETKFDYPGALDSLCDASISFGYAADDYVKEIKLNGEKVYTCSVGCSTEYSKLHKMTINGILQGSNNSLQFTIYNGGTKPNAAGFLFQCNDIIISHDTCKKIKSTNVLTSLIERTFDIDVKDVSKLITDNQAAFIGCLFAAIYLLIILISSKSKKISTDKSTEKSSSVIFALRDFFHSNGNTTVRKNNKVNNVEVIKTCDEIDVPINTAATTDNVTISKVIVSSPLSSSASASALLEVQKKVEAEKVKAKVAELNARKAADKTLKTRPLTVETITEFNAIAAATANIKSTNNTTTVTGTGAGAITNDSDGNSTPTPFLDSFVRRLRQPGFQVERIKNDINKDQLLHLNSKGELVWSKSMFSKTQPIASLLSVFEADDGFIMEFKNKKIIQFNIKESEFPFNASAMITYFNAIIKKIESNPNYVDLICHHPGMKDYDSDDHDAASVNSDFTGLTRSRANSTSNNSNTMTATNTTGDATVSNKIQAVRRPSFGSLRLPSFKMSSSSTTATTTTSKMDGIATNEDATTTLTPTSTSATVYTVIGGNMDGISQQQPPPPASSDPVPIAAPTTLIGMIRRPSFGSLSIRRPSLKSSNSGNTATNTTTSDD